MIASELPSLITKSSQLKFYRKLRKDIARLIVDVREYKISFCGKMTLDDYLKGKMLEEKNLDAGISYRKSEQNPEDKEK